MDTRKLTEILRATIDPNQRQQAEEQLAQVNCILSSTCSKNLQCYQFVLLISDNEIPLCSCPPKFSLLTTMPHCSDIFLFNMYHLDVLCIVYITWKILDLSICTRHNPLYE